MFLKRHPENRKKTSAETHRASRAREFILYLLFGVLTTLVNILSYALLAKGLALDYKPATAMAWALSVLFAYVTNKRYVFQSPATALPAVLKELGSFVVFRLASLGLDMITMVISIEILRLHDLVAKIIANSLVIAFNYLASKFVIFRKPLSDHDAGGKHAS